jgi:hypothetical protein
MVSKQKLKTLIDEVGDEFERCWQILSMMKSGKIDNSSPLQILSFQPILAAALYRLDVMYFELANERHLLILRKRKLNANWFSNRMRIIATYQNTLNDVIRLGRALGDSFAWVFYENDRDLLDKHFAHEKHIHGAQGLGAEGELKFVQNEKSINGFFVLYHNITTYLRIGDISLIDLQANKVVALGDLKTVQDSPRNLSVTLYLIGPDLQVNRVNTAPTDNHPDTTLPHNMQERLKRQLNRMTESFVVREADYALTYHDNSRTQGLISLLSKLRDTEGGSEKAGSGLLLVGLLNSKSRKLSNRFSNSAKSNARIVQMLDRYQDGFFAETINVLKKASFSESYNDNVLWIGILKPNISQGTIPLFWRNIPTELLKRIFFAEFFVFTIYNPAHLIGRIRELGFEIKYVNGGRRYEVTKKEGNIKMKILNMNYYEKLVTEHLVNEDVIVDYLSDILKLIQSGAIGPNTRVDLNFRQKH